MTVPVIGVGPVCVEKEYVKASATSESKFVPRTSTEVSLCGRFAFDAVMVGVGTILATGSVNSTPPKVNESNRIPDASRGASKYTISKFAPVYILESNIAGTEVVGTVPDVTENISTITKLEIRFHFEKVTKLEKLEAESWKFAPDMVIFVAPTAIFVELRKSKLGASTMVAI